MSAWDEAFSFVFELYVILYCIVPTGTYNRTIDQPALPVMDGRAFLVFS